MAQEFSIFCGNASRTLAAAVARAVGVPLGAATVDAFRTARSVLTSARACATKTSSSFNRRLRL